MVIVHTYTKTACTPMEVKNHLVNVIINYGSLTWVQSKTKFREIY